MSNYLFQKIKSIDMVLVFSMLFILLAGLLTMSSFGSNDEYFYKQSFWIFISMAVFYFSSRLDFRFLKSSRVVMYLYGIMISILTLLFVLGKVSKGAQSWFSFAGFSFQPSDLMKLVLIILLAKYFSRRHSEIANIRHIIVSFVYSFITWIVF